MKKNLVQAEKSWTILEVLNWTTLFFKANGIDSPRATSEILLSYALKLKRIDLYLQYDKPLNKNELSVFKTLIKRRNQREPLAYITGSKGFWSMDFNVSKDVLIPRPDTECLVSTALKSLSKGQKSVLELGCGSGAVIVSLASEAPNNRFFAIDISVPAIVLSKENFKLHNLDSNITFLCSNWFNALRKETFFDIILSNPPYIPSVSIKSLQPEISLYEPKLALDGGKDGLLCLKNIINEAHFYLNPEGFLLLEIGHDQKEGVIKIINECGVYEGVEFIKDYGGNYRVVKMQVKTKKYCE